MEKSYIVLSYIAVRCTHGTEYYFFARQRAEDTETALGSFHWTLLARLGVADSRGTSNSATPSDGSGPDGRRRLGYSLFLNFNIHLFLSNRRFRKIESFNLLYLVN